MKMNTAKTKKILGALAAGWLAAAGAVSHAAEEIRIGWVFAMANAPVLVADSNGYFAEEGLDAKLLSFTSGPLLKQAMVAGEIDLAYIGSPPVYHWFSRGLESKILAKVNYGQAAVVSRKDSGIAALADVKGRKMAGVRKGSGMDVLLRGFVFGEAAGLVPDEDAQIISMPSGNMGPSLESKVVDAAFMWEPFISQFLLRGNTQVIFDINEAVPRYPWYIISAMPEAMEERPDAIVKALRAHRKAVDFLNSGEDAGNDVIAKAFKLGEVTGPDGTVYPATEVVRRRWGSQPPASARSQPKPARAQGVAGWGPTRLNGRRGTSVPGSQGAGPDRGGSRRNLSGDRGLRPVGVSVPRERRRHRLRKDPRELGGGLRGRGGLHRHPRRGPAASPRRLGPALAGHLHRGNGGSGLF